jgi:flagellar basal-body rod modification protein FlgD
MPITAGVTDGYGPTMGAPERDIAEINSIDFMTLLVAQIQNQDPMSPMDNQQFTEQITSFSMLDEMTKMNEQLEASTMMGQSINNTAMLGLVGKDVTVQGNMAWVEDGVATVTGLTTQAPGTAFVEVTDSNGVVVATYEKDVNPGLNHLEWDGLLENGEAAPDGEYSVAVKVMNGEMDIPSTTLMTGAVQSLRYENNVAVVSVGDQEYYVSEIYSVS